ncbi:MAG: DUF1013 domain-containing protein [Alphaproteobacteria bacterium GM7ARS4]|nr:DUF1013 domain-containing protein [Alphaproteobacteria bacterium GM7ARS4]
MTKATPVMPRATARWLIDNTSLSFQQIADFTGLYPIEIEAMADGGVGSNVIGIDPVASDQLDVDEIKRCEADSDARLVLKESAHAHERDVKEGRKQGHGYTPLSKRKHKLDAIAWLVRHRQDLKDGQICALIGTTRPTIKKVRDGTHQKLYEIEARHPVELGLCRREDYDALDDGKGAS